MTGRLPVYLIHWDAPEWCASAAASVLASAGVRVELTILDNGPAAAPPLVDLLPAGVRVESLRRNCGYSGAANAAIADWTRRFPDCELCLVGAHDLHVHPDTFAMLVAVAQERPDCGILAPALVAPYPVYGGRWTGRRSHQANTPPAQAVTEWEWASGTCLLLRRACVAEVGEFDERLESYLEDVDYGLRANEKGWKVVTVAAARAYGLGAASPDSIRRITANTVLLNAKRDGARGLLGSLAYFSGWALRHRLAALVPWRPAQRRARSRHYARQRALALWDLATDGRLVRIGGDRGPL